MGNGWLGALGAGAAGLALLAFSRRAHASVAQEREVPDGLPGELPVDSPTPTAVDRRPDGDGAGRMREHDAADDASAGLSDGPVANPTVSDWSALLAPACLQAGIQLAYALRWGEIESGWNPCAIGYPAAHGGEVAGRRPWKDCPLEIGIAQFYNPDDLLALGMTGTQLRAYCVPGDQHDVPVKDRSTGKIRVVKGFSSKMSRPITREEMAVQVGGMLGLIKRCMASATRDLTSVGAGPAWSPSRRSYWAAVKLQHGLPAVSSQGFPAVTKLLGRPPADWAEFAARVGDVKLSPKFEAHDRVNVPFVIANATDTASVFAEREVG